MDTMDTEQLRDEIRDLASLIRGHDDAVADVRILENLVSADLIRQTLFGNGAAGHLYTYAHFHQTPSSRAGQRLARLIGQYGRIPETRRRTLRDAYHAAIQEQIQVREGRQPVEYDELAQIAQMHDSVLRVEQDYHAADFNFRPVTEHTLSTILTREGIDLLDVPHLPLYASLCVLVSADGRSSPVIALRQGIPSIQRLFMICHELGHWFVGEPHHLALKPPRDAQSSSVTFLARTWPSHEMEHQADIFALVSMLPTPSLLELWRKTGDDFCEQAVIDWFMATYPEAASLGRGLRAAIFRNCQLRYRNFQKFYRLHILPNLESISVDILDEREFQYMAYRAYADRHWARLDSQDRILAVSGSFCTLLGQARSDIIGRPLKELLDEKSLETVEPHLADREALRSSTYFVKYRNGVIVCLVAWPVRSPDGGYAGSFAVVAPRLSQLARSAGRRLPAGRGTPPPTSSAIADHVHNLLEAACASWDPARRATILGEARELRLDAVGSAVLATGVLSRMHAQLAIRNVEAVVMLLEIAVFHQVRAVTPVVLQVLRSKELPRGIRFAGAQRIRSLPLTEADRTEACALLGQLALTSDLEHDPASASQAVLSLAILDPLDPAIEGILLAETTSAKVLHAAGVGLVEGLARNGASSSPVTTAAETLARAILRRCDAALGPGADDEVAAAGGRLLEAVCALAVQQDSAAHLIRRALQAGENGERWTESATAAARLLLQRGGSAALFSALDAETTILLMAHGAAR